MNIKIGTITAISSLALLAGCEELKAQQWTPQVYVGVHGGKELADVDVSSGKSGLDGLGASGWTGGLHAGLDVPFGKVRPGSLVPFAGVYGGYDWGNVKTTMSSGTTVTLGELGSAWYAGGRIGVMEANGAKYYVLGAYRNSDFSSMLGDLKLQGWDAGLGVSFPITRNVELGLEGIYTRYGSEKLGPVDIQPNTLSAMARLNFALGEPKSSIFSSEEDAASACDPKLANCKHK